MTRRQMISAVLQTICLITCSLVAHHILWISAGDKFANIDLYHNYTEALKAADNAAEANNQTLRIEAGAVNMTFSSNSQDNGTSSSGPSKFHIDDLQDVLNPDHEFSFWKTLPRHVFVYTVITILGYYWQIGLERAFPARPRPSALKVLSDEGKLGDDESREEEIVKKWINQGKVRRASLSWWNTFIKWVLDVVIGGLWVNGVYCLLQGLLEWKPIVEVLKGLKGVILAWATSLISSRPLASLLAFVIVPANKRVVFSAGMDLAFWTFIGLFINIAIPWFATTGLAQTVIGNMTEAVWNLTTSETPRFTDEL